MPGNWERSPTAGTQRTATPAWRRLRLHVLERDGWRCRIRIEGRCLVAADQVDHITPVSAGGADVESNLRAACGPCHAYLTSKFANAVRARTPKRTTKREPERHPGLRW